MIQYYTLEDCANATGTVVVIDVCRAFTTAAFAFASGVGRIILAADVEEAFAYQHQIPGALIAGEVGGMPVDGFDFWNSPSQIRNTELKGKILILRTSAGTQGMLRSVKANRLIAGSFVVAEATARYLRQLPEQTINFVNTGVLGGKGGVEDIACADYLSGLLDGKAIAADKYLSQARECVNKLEGMEVKFREVYLADFALCLEVDRYNFVMVAERINQRLELFPNYF